MDRRNNSQPLGQRVRPRASTPVWALLLAALLLFRLVGCSAGERAADPFEMYNEPPLPSVWERATSHEDLWTQEDGGVEEGLYPKVEEWKRNMKELMPEILKQLEDAGMSAEAKSAAPEEPSYRRSLQTAGGPIQRLGLSAPGLNEATISPAAIYASMFRHDSIKSPPTVDWRITAAMTPVPRQLECESCWAMAVADSISIMWALSEGLGSIPSLPPGLTGRPAALWPAATEMSVQQILDCANGADGCQGGWPEWAYNYVVDNGGLVPGVQYGYLGRTLPCVNNLVNLTAGAQITGWERTPMMDVAAIKKAVANQPVLTFISAVSTDFQFYTGGIYGADGTSNCTMDLDHVVLIVGYGTDANLGPYWIIKNTWGTDWGEGGYMRIAMQDGAGVCGITSSPGLYPVYMPSASSRNLCYVSFPPPCGAGYCFTTDSNTVLRCWCSALDGFTEFVSGGTSKCVASDPCARNPDPCGPGACSHNLDGTYACACDPGCLIGAKADGSQTCIYVGNGVATYTVTASDTCQSMIKAFGLSHDSFMQYNGALDCNNLLPGTVVAVGITASSPNCTATYVVAPNDTLVSIAGNLSTTVERLLQLNPTLSSALHDLDNGLTLCVNSGQLQSVSSVPPTCGQTYSVLAGGGRDQCAWILSAFNITHLDDFLSLNPGLTCPGPSDPPLPPSLVVCVKPQSLTTLSAVDCTLYYTVQHGDSCPVIWNSAALTASQFFLLNPGIQCDPHSLKIGQTVCVQGPPDSAANNFTTTIPYEVDDGDTLAIIAGMFRSRCGIYASPASICTTNQLANCSQDLKTGSTLQIPCQWPVGRSCGCPSAGVPVCGSDGNWYPNYCAAVCNYATPANAYANGGCNDLQLACSGHSCFGTPDWSEDYFPRLCPWPTWWPIDYSWWGTDVCSFYRGACFNCCTGSLPSGYYQGYPMILWYVCYDLCRWHVDYGC